MDDITDPFDTIIHLSTADLDELRALIENATSARVVIDDGLKVSVDSDTWTEPLGRVKLSDYWTHANEQEA